MALCAETKAWAVAYGKECNFKYRTEMEEIFSFIEDMTKRLNRPIKDLDDIRLAMIALKEIRDNEIRIDMSISPIEVGVDDFLYAINTNIPLLNLLYFKAKNVY